MLTYLVHVVWLRHGNLKYQAQYQFIESDLMSWDKVFRVGKYFILFMFPFTLALVIFQFFESFSGLKYPHCGYNGILNIAKSTRTLFRRWLWVWDIFLLSGMHANSTTPYHWQTCNNARKDLPMPQLCSDKLLVFQIKSINKSCMPNFKSFSHPQVTINCWPKEPLTLFWAWALTFGMAVIFAQ